METTKQKVNVKEIMDRAKNKTEKVKQSTEAVKSKTADFRIVPGFSKYEFNGNFLRNVKTKNPISFKTGRTKYQLFDEKGISHNLSKEDLIALMPKESTVKEAKPKKEAKAKKEPKPNKEAKEKKYHHVPNPLPLDQLKPDARKIMAFPDKSYNQVIKLFDAGYSKDEIITITGKRNDVISKYLRPLLKGKK